MGKQNVNINHKNDAVILLDFIHELSKFKYEEENAREQSLIRQSSQMQTVFSFITAALYMLLPVIIDHRGRISLTFIFIWVSIITLFLIISLVTASLSQWRYKIVAFPNTDVIREKVGENFDQFLTREQQLTDYNNLIIAAQKSKYEKNNTRVIFITISMVSFYISMTSIIVFFTSSIYQLIWR